MKKWVYSSVTKAVAVILLVAFFSAALSLLGVFVKNGIEEIFPQAYVRQNRQEIYDSAAGILYNCMAGHISPEEATKELSDYPVDYRLTFDGKTIESGNLPSVLSDDTMDGGEYEYITSNDTETASNSAALSSLSSVSDGKPFEAALRIDSEKFESEISAVLLEQNKSDFKLYVMCGCLLISLALLVFLLFVAGREAESNEIKLILVDRLPVEITGGLLCLSGAGISSLAFYWLCEVESVSALSYCVLGGVGISVLLCVPLAFLLSLVRVLKAREFLNHWLFFRIVRRLWRDVRKSFVYIRRGLFQKAGIGACAILAIYTLILLLFHSPMLSFLAFIVVCAGMVYGLKHFDDLKKGIMQIRMGNTAYKIESRDKGVIGEMCNAIDSIGEGVNEAVSSRMKAERMKSELITNVSHDLKTPLTSIINYSGLLSEMELTPAEANDYVRIVGQKAERLKTLTADLFDMAKVQSGNEQVVIEKLDFATLVRQTLGEMSDAVEQSGLEMISNLPNGITVNADGKKMARVLENLTGNALKYAMPGTRVYFDLKASGNEAILEVKNISALPLDFNPEEITERFVRGDAARSTEGNGLGLAIAKSYTEACGGILAVSIDGDLFKVTVRLPLAADF